MASPSITSTGPWVSPRPCARALSVRRTMRWSGRLQFSITTTGVSMRRPCASRRCAVAMASRPPMYCTRVSQSGMRVCSGSPGAVLEVKKATLRETPRLVSGCCVAAAAASAVVMPGTTSTAMPASSSARNSSSARPNSMGSPPFRRTTTACLRALSTSCLLMKACAVDNWPQRLPTRIFCAWGHSSSISLVTSASCSTTSACASRRAPRKVIKSCAPGPAPIR